MLVLLLVPNLVGHKKHFQGYVKNYFPPRVESSQIGLLNCYSVVCL